MLIGIIADCLILKAEVEASLIQYSSIGRILRIQQIQGPFNQFKSHVESYIIIKNFKLAFLYRNTCRWAEYMKILLYQIILKCFNMIY